MRRLRIGDMVRYHHVESPTLGIVLKNESHYSTHNDVVTVFWLVVDSSLRRSLNKRNVHDRVWLTRFRHGKK